MLTNVYNYCFQNGIIPDDWKKAILSPIYKGGNKQKSDPLSYRPVALISNPCKIFSAIMNERLITYLEERPVITEEQSGFRKKRSCYDHVFVLSSVLRSQILKKKSTFCCFVDFAKAFDSVDRELLMYAL